MGAPDRLYLGQIVVHSIAVFVRWAWIVLPLALLPTLMKLFAALVISGGETRIVMQLVRRSVTGFGAFIPKAGAQPTIFSVIEIAVSLLMATALIVLADALRTGRLPTVTHVLRLTVRRVASVLLMIAVMGAILAALFSAVAYLGNAAGILQGPALIAFVVVLILAVAYGSATWIVALPVAVLEGAYLGALARSAMLTRGHRIALAGVLIVTALLLMLLTVVHGFISFTMSDPWALYTGLLGLLLAEAALFALFVITMVTIHARLREIVDGGTPEALADVFQ